MMIRKRLSAAAMLTLLAAFGLTTACNTIEGAGKDIKSTGKAIEQEADEHH